jgi:hypothetical protein
MEQPDTYNGMQTAKGSTDSQTGKAGLCDGGVDDPLLAEPVEQALGDLVCAVVLGDLLAEDEHLLVGLELLGERLVQGIADCVLLGSGRRIRRICPGLWCERRHYPLAGEAADLGYPGGGGHSTRSGSG